MARPVKVRSSSSAEIPVAQPTKLPEPLRFLADSGILFQINRTVMHPLGLALSVNKDAAAGLDLLDSRGDPVTVYSQDDLFVGNSKFKAYVESVGKDTMKRRKEALGFLQQK